MSNTTPYRILLVCLGNRVRSPLAQGFLRAELDSAGLRDVVVDSAGTHAWPGDEPPEREAVFEAARAGIDIAHLRSRAVAAEDFERFDLVLAMDWDSHSLATDIAAPEQHHKIGHLASHARRHKISTIPDPQAEGYARTLACIEDACEGFVARRLVRRAGP